MYDVFPQEKSNTQHQHTFRSSAQLIMMYISNISDRLSSLIRFKTHFSQNALLLDGYFQSQTLDFFSVMIQSFVARIMAVTFPIMIK